MRFIRAPFVRDRGRIGVRRNVDPDWDEVAAILDDAYRLRSKDARSAALTGPIGVDVIGR